MLQGPGRRRRLPLMPDFSEVADRVWVARYPWFDVNVTVVAGSGGLLVVDTHSSSRAAREVVGDVRRLGAGTVTGVVNTHEHFDHTFGNAVFLETFGAIPVHAHEVAAARTVSAGERIKAEYADTDDPHAEEVLETEIVPADVDVLLRDGDRPRRPGGGAGPPGAGTHTGRPGGAGPRCRRRAGRRPGRGVRAAGVRRGLSSPRVAAGARPRAAADRAGHRGRARPRCRGGPGVRPGPARGHRRRGRDDP